MKQIICSMPFLNILDSLTAYPVFNLKAMAQTERNIRSLENHLVFLGILTVYFLRRLKTGGCGVVRINQM